MSRSKFNYKVYNGKTLKKMIVNSRIYFLAFIFSIGILIGAVSINGDSDIVDKLSGIINSYTILKSGQGVAENFLVSLSSNFLFIGTNLFLSFSLIGFPIIFWIPFLKGLGLGSICGYLYSVYKFSGLGYSLLMVFPGAIVSTFALISACNIGCEYSKNAYLKAITGKGQFEKGETKLFLIRQIVFICICILSSLIDAVFTSVFLRFFEL